MTNGAALGQTAIWSRWDIFIFPTALCVPACVRSCWWDNNRASILTHCARLLCKLCCCNVMFLE